MMMVDSDLISFIPFQVTRNLQLQSRSLDKYVLNIFRITLHHNSRDGRGHYGLWLILPLAPCPSLLLSSANQGRSPKSLVP